MKYKISDVARLGNYGQTEYQNILGCLRNSEKYKDKISTHPIKGDLVEGDIDEILSVLQDEMDSYIKLKIQAENESAEAKGLSPLNDSLRNTVDRLKTSLPTGTQYYEYKTIVIKDSEVLGTVDTEKIDLTLNKYALEGWRLKAAITNEVGHNKAVVVNATINNTVLILERLVTKE